MRNGIRAEGVAARARKALKSAQLLARAPQFVTNFYIFIFTDGFYGTARADDQQRSLHYRPEDGVTIGVLLLGCDGL